MKSNPTHNSQPAADVLRNAKAALERQLGPIEFRPTDRLKAYSSNPRKHPERQIVQLMASISEFGFAVPVLVDVEDTIIAGEARVAAARRLGIADLPVIVADHWSKAQVRAYRLADNRLSEISSWDPETLRLEIAGIIEVNEVPIEILGWNTGEIDALQSVTINEEGEDPADAVPDLPSVPVSRRGDLWRLGQHRLLNGDTLDAENWVQLLTGKIARMAFCDAPYNVPTRGHICGLGKVQHSAFAMAAGEMTSAEFTTFNRTYLAHLSDHVIDGGIIMACMDWRGLSDILAGSRETKLELINLCVWNKTNGGMGSLYRSKHELVLILKKGNAPHLNNVLLGKNGRYRTNVWEYAGANAFGTTRDADLAAHPTVKPVALVADAIRDVSKHGDIVLDAFMGSGTTILAAERTKRVAYGVEIEPKFIDVAIQRWVAITGNEAVLDATGETFAAVAVRRAAELFADAA